MKHLATLVVLVFVFAPANGAEDISPWSRYWNLGVTDVGCLLTREFSNKQYVEYAYFYEDESEIFDSFRFQFQIPNHTRKLGEKTLNANELYLLINAQLHPMVNDEQARIESVQFENKMFGKIMDRPQASFRLRYLDGANALEIFRRLQKSDPVTLILGLSNNKSITVHVPSFEEEKFSVWSKVLYACAEFNTP